MPTTDVAHPPVDTTAGLRSGLRWLSARYPIAVGALVVYVLAFGPPSVYVQSLAAALGIVFFGLPHGAVDTLVAHKLKMTLNPLRLFAFLVVYLGLAGLAVAFWLAAPTAALLTFLLISAWHFGGDWSPTILGFDRFIVGVALLCSTTLLHQDDVAIVFASLISTADANLLASSMFAVACTLLPVAACLPFKPEIRSTAPRVPIIATLTAALALPPLLFFLAYFCWYHSPKHLEESLSGMRNLPVPRVLRTIVGNMLVAVPVMATASHFTHIAEHLVQSAWLQFGFIGLFALTVPHLILEEIRKANDASSTDRTATAPLPSA